MKKMFALREKVESMEAQSAAKVVEERQKLDVVLIENTKKIDVVFAKMEELERELEVLEKERHRVVQQRIAAKDRDEHRRAEFAQFCATVDEHLVPLERTIRNMDVINHSVLIVSEIVHAGFQSLQEELADRGALLKDVKLETHKQHVEVFRGLLLELGEIVYKKERMIEETDKSIQQAHIQQELLAETFNPNAKKFGDVKKRLLSTRDDLEGDVHELKERASTALDGFRLSEDALEKANVDFVHPVSEQEQHTLALRARMVEFKAIANGHVEGQALLEEINALKREMQESRRDIEMTNQSTSGTVNRTLPLIRAAQKARQV
jgi:chromosome segregation ATPase